MEGNAILGTIKVTQRSEDFQSEVTDRNADKLVMGDYVRYTYMEESGAHVNLDINGDQISLRRRDAGLTQAVFHKTSTTTMSVHNEHGVLNFSLVVDFMEYSEEDLRIEYRLIHQEEVVGNHVFELSWKQEEPLCHQNH